MSETMNAPGATSAQNDWVKSVFGLEMGGGGDAPEGPAQGSAQGAPSKPASQKFTFSSLFGKKKDPEPVAGTEPGTDTGPPQPADKDLIKKLKALTDEAAALKTGGIDVKQLEEDAKDLTAQGVSAEKLTDDKAKKTTITALKKRIDEEIAHAKALAKALKSVAGKELPTDDQKAKIYQKALQDFYGIKIEVPDGMKNTHFDKMFDMFGTVPKDHVKQNKLKKLRYVDQTGYGGVYYPTGNIVEMGDFGDASGEEEYEIDGEKQQANSFNVTTLHEIGHSLDDKHNIMGSNQAKAGCGGWKEETQDTVAAALLADCKSSITVSDKVTDDMLKGVINAALDAGTTEQPDTITEDDDWQKILPYLVDHCLPIRDAAQPYFKSSAVATGDRVFTESSKGWWYSYANASRGSTLVNNYQWRSPAEWFAEVYAISWLKKKKPPSGVDASAANYMWKG